MSALDGIPDDILRQVIEMLADKVSVRRISKVIGLHPDRIRGVRDCTWGRDALAEIWERRAREYTKNVAAARAAIDAALLSAALELGEQLQSPSVAVRHKALREIMDRGGLPRTARVEESKEPPLDLSRLSDAELDELDRLQAKARGE